MGRTGKASRRRRFSQRKPQIYAETGGVKIPRKVRGGETTIKIEFSLLEGGGPWGAESKIVQNAVFRGKHDDNKNLKVQILFRSASLFIILFVRNFRSVLLAILGECLQFCLRSF